MDLNRNQKRREARDYSREYFKRKQAQKRLLVDMDRVKAETFLSLLDARGQTFSDWINNKIDYELNRD